MQRGLWSVLKERDFRLIWLASVLSDLGTWMQIGALAIFVTESTGKANWTGVASTISYLTAGICVPVGGVLADRFDRRHLLVFATSLQGVIGLGLVVLLALGLDSPLALILVAGVQGAAGAVVVPALSAMVPDLVSKERSANAALLEAVSWNVGRALGPILAVLVVSVYSYSAVFILNSLSCVGIAVAIYFVSARQVRHHEDGTLVERLQTGWNGLRNNTICWWGTIIAAVEIAWIAPFIALIPVMSQLTLKTSASGSGLLFLGQGIGSALGVILVGSLMHRFGVGKSFVAMMSILPGLLLLYAASPNLVFALVVIIPMSGAHSVVLALAISFVQRFASDAVRGRAMGIHRSVTITSYAVASSLLAVAADAIGLRQTFVIVSLASIAFLVWLTLAKRSALVAILAVDKTTTQPTELDPLSEEFDADQSDQPD